MAFVTWTIHSQAQEGAWSTIEINCCVVSEFKYLEHKMEDMLLSAVTFFLLPI